MHSQTSSSSCTNSEDICLRNYVLRRVSVNWLASSTLQAIPDAVTQKVWPTLMVSTSLCLFFREKFHSSTSHSVLPWVTQICLTSAEKYKPVYPHSHTVNKIRWKRWKYPPINKQQIMQCIEKEKKTAEEWVALEQGEYSMCTLCLSLLPVNFLQKELANLLPKEKP